MRLYQCYRCGESKDWYRFNPGQKYWVRQCIRCEMTPAGMMPVPQESEHRFRCKKIKKVCGVKL